MWEDGFDINEEGGRVKLYKPSQAPCRNDHSKPNESHIGGFSSQEEDPPKCSRCENPMFLLVQLNFPNVAKPDGTLVDRITCVFGCPRSRCFSQMNFIGGFSSSAEGIMTCRSTEMAPVANNKSAHPKVPVAPVKSAWYSTSEGSGDAASSNDWNVDEGNAAMGTDDLEKAVAAMEVNADNRMASEPKSKANKNDWNPELANDQYRFSNFDCYVLTVSDEPDAPIPQTEEDDVGVGGVSSVSDEKIRNMLARYMAEEEDEEILSALRGTTNETDDNGGGGREHDERLTLRDRVLLGFQDRISRSPRQVVRLARGGIPLWSIPIEAPSSNKKKYNKSTKIEAASSSVMVPPCDCGAERVFQFQLLPSLLHILRVDQYSESPSGTSGINALLAGGMDWGAVAVYTCSNSCSVCKEDYLLIQESLDELPDIPRETYEDANAPVAVVEEMDDDADFEPDA